MAEEMRRDENVFIMGEEVAEYQNDKNPEELADILEVIYRVAQLRGVSKEELEKIRIKK